jgi:alpha-amylase
MRTITTVFAVHNHQPVGNFPEVFEEAYRRSYRPFLEVFERHPSVKCTQHWTGPLLDWLVERHPEFIERMKAMVHCGQLELLTGTYYEAVAAVIPEADAIGQIAKLTDRIHGVFDTAPRGMWLAERVWEPGLVRVLAQAGVEFVVLDDTHFRHAGLQERDLRGYYITEDCGTTLKVVPIDKTLRYALPFLPPGDVLAYFQSAASESDDGLVVHADDGEKFGVWPKTYTTVYEERWLDRFCAMLEEHSSWITVSHFSDVLDGSAPAGRVYLPTASYSEMMKWALFPASFRQLDEFERTLKEQGLYTQNAMFVRGGFWRNFLARYPEANQMHKKMLRVSHRLQAVARTRTVPPAVYDHLWAGQCNDPYWHGVFGGLYLPNLRFPVYRNLLEAERALDKIEDLPPIRTELVDFDCDGKPELLVESDEMNLYLTPHCGGSLVELDYKPAAFNLLDIVSRREEGYHHRLRDEAERYKNQQNVHDGLLMKEEGLGRHLTVDWYRHGSLIDHFFGPGSTLEAVARCEYSELGDFVNQPYTAGIWSAGKDVDITLTREGALWLSSAPHRLLVRKHVLYRAGSGSIDVEYTVRNLEGRPVVCWFGVEFNVGLMAGDAHDRYFQIAGRTLADRRLRSIGEEGSVDAVTLVDEWLGMEVGFEWNTPATLWRFPLETVSLSEAGFERLYQSSVILPHWKFTLDGSMNQEAKFRLVQTVRMRRP